MKLKKITLRVVYVILFVAAFTVGVFASETRSTKSASGFYRSDLPSGIAIDGTGQLLTKGYTRNVYVDSNLNTLVTALLRDEVILITTHGNTGMFILADGVNVTGNVLNSASFSSVSELVYISACQTGANSTSSTNVCNVLNNKGVDTVVAFEDNLLTYGDLGGCDRFDSIFVYKWGVGYTVSEALSLAKSQIYQETGSYWGSDSYVVFGNGNLTMN